MPTTNEIISEQTSLNKFGELPLSDLLGRSQIDPDWDLMAQKVTGKSILVTGGGGSIGTEICRQILSLRPGKLIIYDQCEENLYRITEELLTTPLLSDSADTAKIVFSSILGSVTNSRKIVNVLRKFSIDTVFHCAAYKHVPILESDPDEAVNVNVFGTLNVIDACIDHGVETFTFISTDKAVRPINCMGGSKRIAEMILQAKAQESHSTTICMVRFGNVFGSSGSVVPKFVKQISAGGPVTVTHPEITRYLMSTQEASQLVLQASSLAKGGEVFLLDLGNPVKIYDLAVAMIRHAGKNVRTCNTRSENDIEIKIAGLRPGEKMYEELFVDTSTVESSVSEIMIAKPGYVPLQQLNPKLASLKLQLTNGSNEMISREVFNIVKLGATGVDDPNFLAMSASV